MRYNYYSNFICLLITLLLITIIEVLRNIYSSLILKNEKKISIFGANGTFNIAIGFIIFDLLIVDFIFMILSFCVGDDS